MASSTTYDIRLRYLLEDRASREMAQMTREAQRASRATGLLSMGLGKIAALGGGALGLNAARKALIGFNSEAEQAQLVTAGSLALNLGTTVNEQLASARQLATDFRQIAKESVGETRDYVTLAQMIARPVTRATSSMRDLRDMTAGATIAGKAFGFQSEQIALDIESALQGTLSSRDRFARSVIEPLGFDTSAFNALEAKQRFDVLLKGLQSPQLKQMAKLQGESFEGVMSTFQDNLAGFLGAVGKPLFKEITAELRRWNEWLGANEGKLADMAKEFATTLVDGFRAIKDAGAWIVENRGVLMAIAKAFVGFKAASAVGSGVGGFVELFAGAKAAGGGLTGLASMAGKANLALGGIAVAVGGIEAFAANRMAALEKRQTKALEVSTARGIVARPGRAAGRHEISQARAAEVIAGTAGPLTDQEMRLGRLAATGLRDTAGGKDLLGTFDPVALRQAILDQAGITDAGQRRAFMAQAGLGQTTGDFVTAQEQTINAALLSTMQEQTDLLAGILVAQQAGFGQAAVESAKMFATRMNETFTPVLESLGGFLGFGGPDTTKVAKAPKVNVTIHRIEVQSDDPDRFVFQMVDSFKDLAKSPGSALNAFREG